MPTPVKNVVPPAAAPVKPARGMTAPGAGESFQEELVRRRGGDRAKAEAAKPQAAKAEPKRAPRARKSSRGGRGEPGRDAEAPQVRADASGGAAPPDPGAGETAGARDTSHAEGAAPVRSDEEESGPVDRADAAAVAPLAAAQVAAPVAGAPADGGEGGEGDEPDAGVVAGRIANRPAAYHAGGAGDPADAGEAPGGEGAAPATDGGGVAALFDGESDGPSGEGATSDGERGASAGGESASTDESAIGEVPAGDEAQTSAGRAHAKATDAPPHGGAVADAILAAGPGDKPEMRAGGATPPASPAAPAVPPEVRFAAANHEAIVTSMRGELMPGGGSMRIRLDPPQLGALQVTVQIRDGVVTASFETSNDEATRLLGHSLNQLKTVLESHGVAVDKLQVQQAPREAQAPQPHDEGRREQGGPSQEQDQQARQEQQRREMLRRMWRRLSGGRDPLDLTA